MYYALHSFVFTFGMSEPVGVYKWIVTSHCVLCATTNVNVDVTCWTSLHTLFQGIQARWGWGGCTIIRTVGPGFDLAERRFRHRAYPTPHTGWESEFPISPVVCCFCRDNLSLHEQTLMCTPSACSVLLICWCLLCCSIYPDVGLWCLSCQDRYSNACDCCFIFCHILPESACVVSVIGLYYMYSFFCLLCC